MCNKHEDSTLPPPSAAEIFRDTVDQGLREGRVFFGTPKELFDEAASNMGAARTALFVSNDILEQNKALANGTLVDGLKIDTLADAAECRSIARDHVINARALRRVARAKNYAQKLTIA